MKIKVYQEVKVNVRTKDLIKENVIYCLTFPNNKQYIGLTTQQLDKRIKEHCYDSFRVDIEKYYNNKKAKAIRKYQEFSVSVLYEGEDLDQQEIY